MLACAASSSLCPLMHPHPPPPPPLQIFDFNGSTWVPTRVVASDGVANAYFGAAVAVSDSGNRVLVGAPKVDTSYGTLTGGPGGVYVYSRTALGAAWTVSKVLPADGAAALGTTLSISADGATFVAGAWVWVEGGARQLSTAAPSCCWKPATT